MNDTKKNINDEIRIEYAEFFEAFLNEKKLSNREEEVYKNLFNKLTYFEKFITEWDNYDLDKYIKSLGSISENTILKYSQYIKNFYNYICRSKNTKTKHLFLTRDNKYYIDYEKLFAVVLDQRTYDDLRHLLIEVVGNKEYNTRDKLLVELAWEGINVDEIKNIKIDDVVFDNINNREIAKIKTKNRIVSIYDMEVIKDIKKTKAQDEYYLPPKTVDRKVQYRKFKDTDYLIRSIQTNKSESDTVANPSQIIKKVFERVYVFPGIDLENLTLEAIRRSRAIEMFKNNVSLQDVGEFLGKKTICDLYWLQDIAQKIKRIEEKINNK